jgi:hypothetical protein
MMKYASSKSTLIIKLTNDLSLILLISNTFYAEI